MTHHEPLPIENYDQMSVETLYQAIRPLTEDDLHTVLDYEQRHADRPLFKRVLMARIDELEAGGQPSEGQPPSGPPSTAPRSTDRVRPDTQAEPIIPPSHGVPTTHRPRQGPRR